MVLRIDIPFRMYNPQCYPTGIVDELRELLTAGVSAYPDSKRENFYDVKSGQRVFFIYVSPAGSAVTLLAAWPKRSIGRVSCPGTQLQTAPNAQALPQNSLD